MARNFMKEQGVAAHRSGFNVIPIMPNEKRPGQFDGAAWSGMSGWSRFCRERAADGTVDMWSGWPGAGVGIACGHVVAVDVDVMDADAADDIEVVLQEKLGNTPLKRVGRAPKFLLVYRTSTPFKKMKLGPIEVLGDGQQFVAWGVHPVTGRDYTWPEDNPADTPMGLLPLVTPDQVAAAIQEAYNWVPPELQAGPGHVTSPVVAVRSGETGRRTSILGLEAHRDAVTSAAEYIPNRDLHWDCWNRIGMMIWASSGGSDWGRDIWFDISAKSSKFGPDATQERWSHYFVSPPTEVGAGSLFKEAADNGWICPVEISFRSGRETEEQRAELDRMIKTMFGGRYAEDGDCQQTGG